MSSKCQHPTFKICQHLFIIYKDGKTLNAKAFTEGNILNSTFLESFHKCKQTNCTLIHAMNMETRNNYYYEWSHFNQGSDQADILTFL